MILLIMITHSFSCYGLSPGVFNVLIDLIRYADQMNFADRADTVVHRMMTRLFLRRCQDFYAEQRTIYLQISMITII